jgi:beta-galactosidase
MGFLVMDEFFDVWKAHKVSEDYATYFTKWYQTDAADIVKRDRNHPSVVIYSIGNEIRDALATRSPIAKDLVSICHGSDATRPVTQALFRPSASGDYPGATVDILDVFGVNYRNLELDTATALGGKAYVGISTEMAQTTSLWASFYLKKPQIVGEYLWSGADYLGEAGTWPTIGASAGLIDRVGTIKAIGYSYQSIWSAKTSPRPATATSGAAKIVLTVDHATITTDLNDVAYVKASVTNASGAIVSSASDAVTFAVEGTAGKILAVDSGNDTQESYTGNVRNAFEGVCYAIVRMTSEGSITVTASASGLTGSSVTVTGTSGTFIPCSGTCD